MSRRGQLNLFELDLIRRLLGVIEYHLTNQKEHLTMTLLTNNDNAVRLRPSGVDRDGVSVSPTGLTVSVDHPEIASVAADPANPGSFLVTPLPATDPAAGSRTVIVTTTDPATGLSVETPIEFDPGLESSLVVATTLVPLPPVAAQNVAAQNVAAQNVAAQGSTQNAPTGAQEATGGAQGAGGGAGAAADGAGTGTDGAGTQGT